MDGAFHDKKILLTGFEPFGTHLVNASGLIAEKFNGRAFGNFVVEGRILPVSYERSVQHFIELLNQQQWDAVIATGVTDKSDILVLERLAVNLNHSHTADNDAIVRLDKIIEIGGPAAYFSTLPLMNMQRNLRAKGIEHKISLSAGSYVCNHIFYTLMHELQRRRMSIPAGFIHLPAGIGLQMASVHEQELLEGAFTGILQAMEEPISRPEVFAAK